MAQIVGTPQVISMDQVRAEKCLAEIKKTLTAYNCQVQPVVQIIGDQIQSFYRVVAIPAVPPDIKG